MKQLEELLTICFTWRGLGLRGGFSLRSGEAESQTACENLEDDNLLLRGNFYYLGTVYQELSHVANDSFTHCTSYRAVATDVLSLGSTPFIADCNVLAEETWLPPHLISSPGALGAPISLSAGSEHLQPVLHFVPPLLAMTAGRF